MTLGTYCPPPIFVQPSIPPIDRLLSFPVSASICGRVSLGIFKQIQIYIPSPLTHYISSSFFSSLMMYVLELFPYQDTERFFILFIAELHGKSLEGISYTIVYVTSFQWMATQVVANFLFCKHCYNIITCTCRYICKIKISEMELLGLR